MDCRRPKLVIDDNALVRRPRLAIIRRRADAYPEMALQLNHGSDFNMVDPDGEAWCDRPGTEHADDRRARGRGHPPSISAIRTSQRAAIQRDSSTSSNGSRPGETFALC